MKNLKFLIPAMGILIGTVSCQKEKIEKSKFSVDKTTTLSKISFEKFASGHEIIPLDENQFSIVSFTRNFINQTDSKLTTLKSTTPVVDKTINEGSWLFEAGSNYLMNNNQIKGETDFVNYSISIDKTASGLMNGEDLITKFNSFIANIDNYRSSEGYSPKIIDVRLGQDLTNSVEMLINVSYGEEVLSSAYNFPTQNVTIEEAAVHLSNALSSYFQSTHVSSSLFASSGSISVNSIFLSNVTTHYLGIFNDLNGAMFFTTTSITQYLYPYTDFLVDENRFRLSVLNFCLTNNIPSNKIWNVKVSFDSTIPVSQQLHSHYLKNIQTADVNVM